MNITCEKKLETFILKTVNRSQKKVAFVIGAAILEFKLSESDVAVKISEMCKDNKLTTHGDISNFRHSEVSLPK